MIIVESRDYSNKFKPTSYFRDATANGGQSFKLDEIALKSDIPSGVDLTNYEGDWNLTKTNTVEDTNYIDTFNNTPIQYDETSVPFIELSQTIVNEASYGLYIVEGNASLASATNGVTYDQYILGNTPADKPYKVYHVDLNGITHEAYDTGNKLLEKRAIKVVNRIALTEDNTGSGGIKCSIEFFASSSNSPGITFLDHAISNDSFTLKSLVDRIATLESKVTELETALANKANVNSPSFTGKVTINPITE